MDGWINFVLVIFDRNVSITHCALILAEKIQPPNALPDIIVVIAALRRNQLQVVKTMIQRNWDRTFARRQ